MRAVDATVSERIQAAVIQSVIGAIVTFERTFGSEDGIGGGERA